jgi:hypothetical protein
MPPASARSLPPSTLSVWPRSCARLVSALALLALVLVLGSPSPCRAAFVLVAPDVQATPGESGSFDVVVTNTNGPGGPDFDVSAFIMELALSGPPGVQFTSVTINTTIPYLFVSSGTLQPGADPFSTDSFPNTDFLASDAEFAPAGFRTVSPGQTFGLAHVFYTVDSATLPGVGSLTFGPGTSVSDGVLQPLPFDTLDGTFTVVGVPEPSSLLLTASGLGLALLARRGRRASPPAA